jgi:iron(III) transport system substrate-binding protein
VVVYVAHDLIFSGPVLDEFERRSGIRVKAVGDTEASKTTTLVTRLLELAGRPEADVFWNNEVMGTVRLADRGLLQPYVPPTAVGIPQSYCDSAGRWVGFAARARVILYNTRMLEPGAAPASILDLTQARYRGKVVVANPLFGTTATHVAALFAHWGAGKAKEYLVALKENGVHIASGNAMARNLVMDGEFPICLTDTDDANGALLRGKPVRMVYADQGEGGLGTLVIPNTVALLREAPHPEEGRRLVDFIASGEVEERLARSKAAQMPLRDKIEPYGPQFDFSAIRKMEVDWNRVAEKAEESAAFVRAVFLR